MKTVVRLLIYVLFVAAVYVEEYDVPVMLYLKRARFLTEWKIAAAAQKRAIKSYLDYQDEAEYVRG